MDSDSDFSEYESDDGRVFVYAPGWGLMVKPAGQLESQDQGQGPSSQSGNFNRERSPESIGPNCDISDEAFRAERQLGDKHVCVYNDEPVGGEYDPTESDFVYRALRGSVNDFMEVVERVAYDADVRFPRSAYEVGIPIGTRVVRVVDDVSGPDVVVVSLCRYTNTYQGMWPLV
ncbi:hypothetical protein HDU98_000448 [Podochytrium sp. JEL0797]|nr:hypothetical protein HDU98_000448 [Podochytrium sp. JEL0797]